MGYEVFKRTATRVEAPVISVTPDGRIVVNAAAVRVLKAAGVKYAVLLWDRPNRRIAIRAASKGDPNAYAVTVAPQSHSGSIRAKAFLHHIGWNAIARVMLPSSWSEKEKMLEAEIPDQYVRTTAAAQDKRKPTRDA